METRPQKQKRESRPGGKAQRRSSAPFVPAISSWRFRRKTLFNDRERAVFANSRRRAAFLRESRFNLRSIRRIGFYNKNGSILAARFRFWNRWRINWAIDAENRFRRDELFASLEDERVNKGDRGPDRFNSVLFEILFYRVDVFAGDPKHAVILSIRTQCQSFYFVVRGSLDQGISTADNDCQKHCCAQRADEHFPLRKKAVCLARNQYRHKEAGRQKITGHAQRSDDVGNKAYTDQNQH